MSPVYKLVKSVYFPERNMKILVRNPSSNNLNYDIGNVQVDEGMEDFPFQKCILIF